MSDKGKGKMTLYWEIFYWCKSTNMFVCVSVCLSVFPQFMFMLLKFHIDHLPVLIHISALWVVYSYIVPVLFSSVLYRTLETMIQSNAHKQAGDAELESDVKFLHDVLAKNYKELSTFDKWASEVHSGSLRWSIDWLSHWLISWVIDWLIESLID